MNAFNSTTVFQAGALRFWIHPDRGAAYEIDLSEFAFGGRRDHVDPRARDKWSGDYQGRRPFAYEFAEHFQLSRPPEGDKRQILSFLRTLFRFLDEIDPGRHVSGCSQLEDGHGALLQRWAEARGLGGQVYKGIKGIVDAMRAARDEDPLFWPARHRDVLGYREDIDEKGVQRLFNAFKKEAMSIKSMFREGEVLAARGSDPRGEARLPSSADWEARENHAWLVHELTRERLLYKEEVYANQGQGLNKANDRTLKHDGPEYLAPGMGVRGREGIVGKLRWFHPSYHDTAVFLWLFLLGTGWNLATALALDVTADNEWCQDHPQKPEFKIVHSYKERADRHVFALSLAKPEWHPYRIVRFMIERTAPMRRTVEHRLGEARERHDADPTPARARDVARLEAVARSPWLYHVVNKVGEVSCFEGQDCARLNEIARVVAKGHGLAEEHPSLLKMATGDSRDAWIGHAYAASGYDILIAKLGAQHADTRVLRHYLRQRRYRAHSEAAVRRVQDAAFAEIATGRKLDPTRLRILVEKGEITAEQERRLLDKRQRTRLGMGCLDPRNPPREVAPTHVEGSLCRVQRCTGCVHGLVFEDSLEPLARARAELIFIKRTFPLTAWAGSSWEDEERSLDATLAEFGADRVEPLIDHFLGKLTTGEIQPHDTYSSY
ncbi:hypothetical protein KHP60_09710 [Microvirga sp. 3-52]|uniref:hypothetical protein n=1 Tax=Microvirga sp. 3-52 TaxID=2792425 RepID=UPI001AD354E0|nr:hypothetical protein [Microvirga sp. 3-52]MBO1905301.1 hypothetical protein [Microvirga sp. 3-52]MBS7452610.1 hypothetical protein [Microvirga sp. 3-52]